MDYKKIALIVVVVFLVTIFVFKKRYEGAFVGTLPLASFEELDSFLSIALESGGDYYDSLNCKRDACAVTSRASLPTYAWRLLGWTGLYKATLKEKYKHLALEDFAALSNATKQEPPLVSLHQVFEAWNTFKDPEMAKFLYRWMHYSLASVRKSSDAATSDVMTLSTLARQLWLASAFVENSDNMKLLEKLGLYSGTEEEKTLNKDFAKQALRLTQRAGESLKEEAVLPQRCFQIWNLEAAYQVTGSSSYYRKIKELLNPKFLAEQQTTQMLLPCLDVLGRIPELGREVDVSISEYLPWFLSVVWDKQKEQRCNGDGGVFSVLQTSADICNAYSKSTADSGWTAFILGSHYKSE